MLSIAGLNVQRVEIPVQPVESLVRLVLLPVVLAVPLVQPVYVPVQQEWASSSYFSHTNATTVD